MEMFRTNAKVRLLLRNRHTLSMYLTLHSMEFGLFL